MNSLCIIFRILSRNSAVIHKVYFQMAIVLFKNYCCSQVIICNLISKEAMLVKSPTLFLLWRPFRKMAMWSSRLLLTPWMLTPYHIYNFHWGFRMAKCRCVTSWWSIDSQCVHIIIMLFQIFFNSRTNQQVNRHNVNSVK